MTIINEIEKQFLVSCYRKKIDTDDDIELLLIRGRLISRYCLAVFRYDPSVAIFNQIESARQVVKKYTKAIWFFREVGAYLVFVSEESENDIQEEDLSVDLSGLHSVIIQGTHVMMPGSRNVFKHSKWLNYTFGGANLIANELTEINERV